MKKLVFVLLFFSFIVGCKTKKEIVYERSDSLVYIEKLRFDTIITPADSSWLKAFFKCDSLGNVYISELLDLKSKGVGTSVNFSNGVLSYETKRDEKKNAVPCIDSYTDKKTKEIINTTKIIVKMSFFQKVFFWIGLISVIVFSVILYFKIKK